MDDPLHLQLLPLLGLPPQFTPEGGSPAKPADPFHALETVLQQPLQPPSPRWANATSYAGGWEPPEEQSDHTNHPSPPLPYPTLPTWVFSGTAAGDPTRNAPPPPDDPARGPFHGFEMATKYSFDYARQTWLTSNMPIKMSPTSFARGGMRAAYHVTDAEGRRYVAKASLRPRPREWYFSTVVTQATSQHYANRYNDTAAPKKIWFLDTFVLEQTQVPGLPVLTVEDYLEGRFAKYNDNAGWTAEDERNTPQAFSHFTHMASEEQLMVVDIQGVGDWYTDPQIHSRAQAFGGGDMGMQGFVNFFRTHRCNHICVGLKIASKLGTHKGTIMVAPGDRALGTWGHCLRVSPAQGPCLRSPLPSSVYCDLHHCPVCGNEKASGASACPQHIPVTKQAPAVPPTHTSAATPPSGPPTATRPYPPTNPDFLNAFQAFQEALQAVPQDVYPTRPQAAIPTPSTCCYKSSKGACRLPPATGALFCDRHRCPRCGQEKPGTELTCPTHVLPAGVVEGTVKSFSHKSGWGFIHVPEANAVDLKIAREVLFHRADLGSVGAAKLRPGLVVQCKIITTEKGHKAKEVFILEHQEGV